MSHPPREEVGRRWFASVVSRAMCCLGPLLLVGAAHASGQQAPPAEPPVPLRVGLTVFELKPLLVEVPSAIERERLASGTALYHLERRDIEEYIGGGTNLGDVLRMRVPGISSTPRGSLNGVPACVEFRGAGSERCSPPVIIVDGVRIGMPNHFLDTMPLEHVESLTVLSAAVAGARYGEGALAGVIRVETRRPPGPPGARVAARSDAPSGSPDAPRERPAAWTSAYDWRLEESSYPWVPALGAATAGTLGGLALALSAAGPCSPVNALRAEQCSSGDATLASIATFTLPVLGAAIGANLMGRTDKSRGKLLMTTVSALTPMFMGYFFATPNPDGIEFEGQMIFGRALILVGVPVMAALADKVFRVAHGP